MERDGEWSAHIAEVKRTGASLIHAQVSERTAFVRVLSAAQVLLREAQEILAGEIEGTQVLRTGVSRKT